MGKRDVFDDAIELEERLVSSASDSVDDLNDDNYTGDFDVGDELNASNGPKVVQFQGQELSFDSPDWRQSYRLRFQIFIGFLAFFILGLNDQTIGTLLPTLVKKYNTSQTSVSLVFMLQFLGYGTSALSNNYLHLWVGRFGTLIIAVGCFLIPFSINSIHDIPLPLYISVHFLTGLSVGLYDSSLGVWVGGLVDHNELMGMLHGFYGIGSVVSPPFISFILRKYDEDYTKFYRVLVLITLVLLVLIILGFKGENGLKYRYYLSLNAEEDNNNDDGASEVKSEPDDGFWRLLNNKVIQVFSLYLFLYLGAEISIASWMLTFLKKVKNLEQLESSFVVSMFWIGLTFGRIGLAFVTRFFKNEFRANRFYTICSVISHFIFATAVILIDLGSPWNLRLIKLLIFLNGTFIGPLFPTSSICLLKILPNRLHVLGVGVMSSLGCTGSAVLPFLVGFIANATNFQILPLLIGALILGYCLVWMSIPYYTKIKYYDF